MNFVYPSLPHATNPWQYLVIIAGLSITIYLVGTEQYGHYLYWKKWKKNRLSFFTTFSKKRKTSWQKITKKNGIIFFKIIQNLNHRKRIVTQFPLFLQTLGNALQAGYSFENALSFLAEEVDEPLKNEIKNINQKIKLHISIPDALRNFAKKIDHPDIHFFVESTNIQLKTGGNLIELFQKVTGLLEEKSELQRNIKSFTAQGKMSGILIAILWPVSLFLFSFLSPEHIQILFHTTKGLFLLGLSLALELFGFLFIWKIIRIKI